MNRTSLSNFLNNTEALITNTIDNEEITIIESDEGNVVLISEKDFLELMDSRENLQFISNK